ncbi:hypothetical protein GH714_030028 [Hevea brasiliensis]|uniref:CASP-like protein n=1 Tax=Hevea brasiliensis TaxID=3981 RepID=A0A6A6MQI6_HEVBR|nr:hypothetical protein GH714_030028 [Hevea brasiliensis]
MKRSSSSNSDSHFESPHSPLRLNSPLPSDQGDPHESPPFVSPMNSPGKSPPMDNSMAIVAVNKFPKPSPLPQENAAYPQAPAMTFNRAVREEGPPVVGKLTRLRGGVVIPMIDIENTVRPATCDLESYMKCVFNLFSGRVLARGHCLCVATTAWYTFLIREDLLCWFNWQILAYLLISAASSAATRVDDWQSNWGKDEFTEMASASVAMAFLAFIAFAVSSLISGYNLYKNS